MTEPEAFEVHLRAGADQAEAAARDNPSSFALILLALLSRANTEALAARIRGDEELADTARNQALVALVVLKSLAGEDS